MHRQTTSLHIGDDAQRTLFTDLLRVVQLPCSFHELPLLRVSFHMDYSFRIGGRP